MKMLEAQIGASPTHAPKLVLIVDADLAMGAIISACLSDDAWTINTAAKPTELASAIRRGKPDLIVFDVSPDQPANNALLNRVEEIAPRIPVIRISASGRGLNSTGRARSADPAGGLDVEALVARVRRGLEPQPGMFA